MSGRKYLRMILILLLILSIGLQVLAEEPVEPEPEPAPAAETASPESDLPPRDVPADDPRFLDRSWDEIMTEFLARKYAPTENVGIVYYNTVTGETHMINGDQYFYAASLYKLPLNMHFGEKIYNGEMSMDDKIYGLRYGDMQRSSLQFSANWTSETLQGYLGGMSAFVDAILPYILDEGEEGSRNDLMTNSFTPAQMLHALKLLYKDPDRYPDVLYYLQLAMPDGFFRQYEKRFPIAHKYGWLNEQGLGIANDVGIVWTDEPILLVFMSNFIPGSTITIGEYCALMCDYTQYWHGRRLTETEAAAQRAAKLVRADTSALVRAIGALPQASS